jgi:3-phenylpropionate/trans-cinnamate dioxygenase ferredoxin reductase component
MARTGRVVIVGGGLAAARCAEQLRRGDPDREIVVLAAETLPPYDRPPLTKAYLRDGGAPPLLKPDWAALDVDMRLAVRAEALDLDRAEVRVGSGDAVGFDDLVIATGARPRRLPGLDGPGVHTIRDVADADALRADLHEHRAVTIVGAGFIGCEIASTARSLGARVTLIEALAAPLARVLGTEVGHHVAAMHRDNGCDLYCDAAVISVHGSGAERELELASGRRVPARVAVVGLGVTPETGWLAGSGLAIDDGVLCDEVGRTSHAHVFAAGDAARWQRSADRVAVRQEHWTSAGNQGRTVAQAILGDVQPPDDVPYVWSDQLGVTMQLLGTPAAGDDVTVVPLTDARIVALYGRAGRLTAAFGIGAPRYVMRQRAAIAAGADYAAVVAAVIDSASG